MSYRVEVAPRAVGQLQRLDVAARLHVQAAVELLAEQPRPSRAEQIVGGGEWRVRTGGLRLVYAIDDEAEVLRIVAFGRPVRAIPKAPRLTVPPPEPDQTPPDQGEAVRVGVSAQAEGPAKRDAVEIVTTAGGSSVSSPTVASDEDPHAHNWFRRRPRH
jgi:mRNA interferase RelE/StbE